GGARRAGLPRPAQGRGHRRRWEPPWRRSAVTGLIAAMAAATIPGNKKPGLGRVFVACLADACRGWCSGGLQRLGARAQAALVAGGLVLGDQAAGAEAVEERLGHGEGGLGGGGVVGLDR